MKSLIALAAAALLAGCATNPDLQAIQQYAEAAELYAESATAQAEAATRSADLALAIVQDQARVIETLGMLVDYVSQVAE